MIAGSGTPGHAATTRTRAALWTEPQLDQNFTTLHMCLLLGLAASKKTRNMPEAQSARDTKKRVHPTQDGNRR